MYDFFSLNSTLKKESLECVIIWIDGLRMDSCVYVFLIVLWSSEYVVSATCASVLCAECLLSRVIGISVDSFINGYINSILLRTNHKSVCCAESACCYSVLYAQRLSSHVCQCATNIRICLSSSLYDTKCNRFSRPVRSRCCCVE